MAAGVPRGSILAPCFRVCIEMTPLAPATLLALSADNTRIYVAEKHECCVFCKLQGGLTAVNSWSERWNVKLNERGN
jgi:hypothetical protein